MTAVLELAQELISRRSLTPDDAGCCELIGKQLQKAGFTLEYLNAGGVTNLWATIGQGAPLTILAGHTDVVPAGPAEQWLSDPFTPTIREGVLYGRGAADMKSGIAAMVCAAKRLAAAKKLRGTLAFLITSDEEGAARHGTRHVVNVLQARGLKPDFAIVGEATASEKLGDRITIGRRGSLGCDLKVIGKQGHVAYPDKADNPIHRLTAALSELLRHGLGPRQRAFPADFVPGFQLPCRYRRQQRDSGRGHHDIQFSLQHGIFGRQLEVARAGRARTPLSYITRPTGGIRASRF